MLAKMMGLGALLAALAGSCEIARAQSAASSTPLPAGPHVVLTVPIQLTNVPVETSSVSVWCTIQDLSTGAEVPAWALVPVSSPTPNGQGIDWSGTATVNFTFTVATLGDAQARFKNWRCDLALNFESLSEYYPVGWSRAASNALAASSKRPIDIPLAKNAPKQLYITGPITW